MHLDHFLMSLGWLAVIAAVLSLYLFFPYCLWLLFRWGRAERRERGRFWNRRLPLDFALGLWKSPRPANGDDAWPSPLVRPADWKRFPALALVSLCLCLAVYAQQRKHWLGSGSAHPAAKEYFVVGQVLNVFRHIETARRHPEAPDLRRLARLQWAIYRRGGQLLPADDGESACWQTMWFHSHYYKKGRKQHGLKRWESSPEMVALLDQWWDSLEILGTRPMADKRMLEEQALRNYPALAFQYLRHDGFYTGSNIGSAQRLAMMPKHVERFRLLSDWLWDLQKRWMESPNSIAFLKKHPEVATLHEVALMQVLQGLIQGEIHERKFDCGNASIQRYIVMRQTFAEPKSGRPPVYKLMKDQAQAQTLWDIALDTYGARSTKYVISEYCGVEVAGEGNNNVRIYQSRAAVRGISLDEAARQTARSNYHQEDQILKEQFKRK